MTDDYVVVTTISQFRHRYVMHKDDLCKLNTSVAPTDAELVIWAQDVITCEECEEFSQHHLGEVITDMYTCSEDEMLAFFDCDNDYLKSWSQDYKIEWVRRCLKMPND